MTATVVHVLVLFALPPLLPGVITRVKALFAGRRGPSVLQLYRDLWRLLHKGVVISTTTTWMFIAGPVVTMAALLLGGLMMPLGGAAPLAFKGDLILFAYLLALGRFFTTAAALDTGSPFEGMGAAREMTFACLVEPAIFFALLALVKLSGSLSLSPMLLGPLAPAGTSGGPALVLVVAALFIVLLSESCRIPVDDPGTHLELTMIHEAMVLDHSGPLLGAILYGAAMKLMLLAALLAHVVLPSEPGRPGAAWAVFLAMLLAVAIVVGVVESIMARLRMARVPNLLIAACLLAGFALVLSVTGP